MYQFMTLNDGTSIAHSQALIKDGKEQVRVYFEQPINGGFNCAECWLPEYNWTMIEGFDESHKAYFEEFLASTSHIIIELARNGGFENAANF